MGNGSTQSSGTQKSTTYQPASCIVKWYQHRQDELRAREDYEYNDGVPMAIPAHLQKPTTHEDMLKKFVIEAISAQMGSKELDTIEEFNDFEVEEENMLSGYEISEMEPVYHPDEPSYDLREDDDPTPAPETPSTPEPQDPE